MFYSYFCQKRERHISSSAERRITGAAPSKIVPTDLPRDMLYCVSRRGGFSMRFLLCDLLQIIRKEGTDLLKGDLVHLIVKVGVVSAGYDEQLLVAAGQLLVGVLA